MKKYRKKTDNQIIKAINKQNAVTAVELCNILGYTSIARRLRTMIKKRKIQYLIVGNDLPFKEKLITNYAGRVKLYYTDKKHLKKWLRAQLPAAPSPSERRVITRRLREEFKIDESFIGCIARRDK